MRTSCLQLAAPMILQYFNGAAMRLLTAHDLHSILDGQRHTWQLARSTTPRRFIAFLLEANILREVRLAFPHRTRTLYTVGAASPYAVAMRCAPEGYFTHYTAMLLHDLTDQVPRTVYINMEQPPKRVRPAPPTQAGVDSAFRRPPRVSRNVADYGEYRICVLNGMCTRRLAVEQAEGPDSGVLPVTSIERTLIDITVRPFYAGGVFEVLRAFKLARSKVDLPKLAALLRKLSYVYPYHQAIGFYLERAGVYGESDVRLFEQFGSGCDFYLTHAMSASAYNSRWKLHVPKGL